jgi:hypothetical protein
MAMLALPQYRYAVAGAGDSIDDGPLPVAG